MQAVWAWGMTRRETGGLWAKHLLVPPGPAYSLARGGTAAWAQGPLMDTPQQGPAGSGLGVPASCLVLVENMPVPKAPAQEPRSKEASLAPQVSMSQAGPPHPVGHETGLLAHYTVLGNRMKQKTRDIQQKRGEN